MKTTVESKGQYLVITPKGTMTVQEMHKYAATVIEAVNTHKVNRILLDERQIIHDVEVLDAYELGESEAIALGARAGYRLACLAHPDNLPLTKAFETTFRNRSLNYKVCADLEEAEAWLLS